MPYVAKLPLTVSSHTFLSLNVNQKNYKCVSSDNPTSFTSTNFIDAYLSCPSALHSISLIEAARSWSYNAHRKKEKWKPRDPPTIVRVLPRYYSIPSIDTPLFIDFCRSELMLYKPFCNIQLDIGASDDAIVTNWQELKLNYTPWHVDWKPTEPLSLSE